MDWSSRSSRGTRGSRGPAPDRRRQRVHDRRVRCRPGSSCTATPGIRRHAIRRPRRGPDLPAAWRAGSRAAGVLERRAPRGGPLRPLLGPSTLELIVATERPARAIFAGRYWGDLGFMHLGFDITGMTALEDVCAARGFPFTVDSRSVVRHGRRCRPLQLRRGPRRHPDRVRGNPPAAASQSFGWYLDLRKRDPTAPLPDWMLKVLRWRRVCR